MAAQGPPGRGAMHATLCESEAGRGGAFRRLQKPCQAAPCILARPIAASAVADH